MFLIPDWLAPDGLFNSLLFITVTLKNAAELLEFATVYNSEQLKVACQEYISINLAAMIEARYLDVLSHDVIQELTRFYKEFVSYLLFDLHVHTDTQN